MLSTILHAHATCYMYRILADEKQFRGHLCVMLILLSNHADQLENMPYSLIDLNKK